MNIFIMENPKKIFGLPPSLVKIVGGIAIFVLLLALLPHQICIHSTCPPPPPPFPPPIIVIVVIVSLTLITFLGIPPVPALLAGAGIWFVIEKIDFLHLFH
jgi:hypothetical protein